MIKKKLSIILAASMIAICMSGCGDKIIIEDVSGDQSTVTEETSEEVTEATTSEEAEATEMTTEAVTETVSETTTEAATEASTEASEASGVAANSGITFDIKSNSLFEVADDGKTLFEGSYDEIVFDEATKNAYSELTKALTAHCTSVMHSVEQMKDENIADIRERYSESPTMPLPYSDNNSMSIRRVDSDILSYKTDVYTFAGGVHGWYGSGGVNYDVKTGKELKLFDVIKDREALITCVQDKLRALYPDLVANETGMIDMVVEDLSESNIDNISWCIDPEGITLFFNPYELGSYAAGMQVIPIAFSENPELFKDSIHKQEGSWAISGNSAYLDTDGNGEYENISIEEDYEYESDNYSYIKGINVVVNGNKHPIELFSYENSYTWITSGGNYFLYVTTLVENDWKGINVYKINGDEFKEVGDTSGYISSSKLEYEYDESGFSSQMKGCMYNPDRFYLATRMNILSTYSGVRLTRVGEDGMPKPIEEWFVSFAEYELTSKIPLELEEVDEAGNVIATNKLEEGTPFNIYRTDGEKYVDLMTYKGSIYRVYIDASGWPQKINGQDIEKVFDGTMFAG